MKAVAFAEDDPVAGTTQHDDPSDDPTTEIKSKHLAGEPSWIRVGATIDSYELVRPIGRGGMGEVWLARDVRLGRLVALKFLHAPRARQVRRFIAEARTTARLTHENIVSLHDVGEHRGTFYMVLEYVQGQSLREWLASRVAENHETWPKSTVPVRQVVELMVPVVRALVYAHEAGVVHRDLKLANVMLADSGKVKVLDFGVAKLMAGARVLDADGRDVTLDAISITGPGKMVGTLAYMSPEQLLGASADPRMDLWAVGIMLHVLAVGWHPLGSPEKPPSADDLASVLNRNISMPSARERHPEVGRLGAIIDRCLVKRPDDRIGSARELLSELEATLPSHPAQIETSAPYSGLSAFQEGDAARFFGRDRAVAQAVARFSERPLLAVIGPSGAGKSSFVRAGLLSALKRGDDAWQGLVVRPGPRPLFSLADLLLRLDRGASSDAPVAPSRESLSGAGQREGLCQMMATDPDYLGEVLRARAARRRERIVLFCDQLEEVFTLAAEAERAAFFACLGGVVAAGSSLGVVVSMRSDFLDRLSEIPAMADLVGPAVFLLGPMTREELRMALVEPARQVDHQFESEAMIAEMLDALAGTVGALPLLQFTASRLWDSRDRQRRVLTQESYRLMGGVAGALASHADAVLASMNGKEKRAARAVLLRLVTPERTRALGRLSELVELPGVAREDIERAVAGLVDARLLAIETGDQDDDKTVELVHESLIDRWAKLGAWLDEAQSDAQILAELRSAAAQWEKNEHAEGLLWRDEAAHRARTWLEGRKGAGSPGISGRELRYIEAVIALSDRTKRRRRWLLAGLFSTTLLVAITVSVLAFAAREQARKAEEQASRAEDQAIQARDEARQARNATRMAAAAREMQRDPTKVLALLREIEPGPAPQGWASLAMWARGAGVARLALHHDEEVTAAAFSPDGRRIASASRDGLLRIWSADGRGEPMAFEGHDGRIASVAFSPDGQTIASASWDGTVRVWNVGAKSAPLVLRGHQGRVTSVAFSSDGRRLVSSSYDKTVRVWDAREPRAPIVLVGHGAAVYSAAFDPAGDRIVSGSDDGTLRLWDSAGRGAPLVLEGHGSGVISVAFSPDGKRVVSASRDQTVRVWKADGSGKPIVLSGHRNVVWSVAFSPDGRRVVSGSWDGTVRVWNSHGESEPDVLVGHEGYIFSVAFSPDGRHILSAAADHTLRTWSVVGEGRTLALRAHQSAVYTTEYSPDGLRLCSASWDNTVRVWSADGAGTSVVLRGHQSHVNTAAFSPDGKRIVSASEDKTVRVWSADGTGDATVLRGHEGAVNSAAFSPDGERLVSASDDGTVRVWSADGTGAPLLLRGHAGAVLWSAFSPDGGRIVSASEDRTVRVWNADGTGAPLLLRGHEAPVYSAVFSPDRQHVFSTSEDKTMRRWSADGRGEPLVFRGHESVVFLRNTRVFSPDGRRIVTSSNDGTARVWDAGGGGEPMVLRGSGAPINSASWSPDGKRIVAALDDHGILVWDDLQPLADAADARLWTATRYCMPLDLRSRLLGFSQAQSQSDLDRCQSRVAEATGSQP